MWPLPGKAATEAEETQQLADVGVDLWASEANLAVFKTVRRRRGSRKVRWPIPDLAGDLSASAAALVGSGGAFRPPQRRAGNALPYPPGASLRRHGARRCDRENALSDQLTPCPWKFPFTFELSQDGPPGSCESSVHVVDAENLVAVGVARARDVDPGGAVSRREDIPTWIGSVRCRPMVMPSPAASGSSMARTRRCHGPRPTRRVREALHALLTPPRQRTAPTTTRRLTSVRRRTSC